MRVCECCACEVYFSSFKQCGDWIAVVCKTTCDWFRAEHGERLSSWCIGACRSRVCVGGRRVQRYVGETGGELS